MLISWWVSEPVRTNHIWKLLSRLSCDWNEPVTSVSIRTGGAVYNTGFVSCVHSRKKCYVSAWDWWKQRGHCSYPVCRSPNCPRKLAQSARAWIFQEPCFASVPLWYWEEHLVTSHPMSAGWAELCPSSSRVTLWCGLETLPPLDIGWHS